MHWVEKANVNFSRMIQAFKTRPACGIKLVKKGSQVEEGKTRKADNVWQEPKSALTQCTKGEGGHEHRATCISFSAGMGMVVEIFGDLLAVKVCSTIKLPPVVKEAEQREKSGSRVLMMQLEMTGP